MASLLAIGRTAIATAALVLVAVGCGSDPGELASTAGTTNTTATKHTDATDQDATTSSLSQASTSSTQPSSEADTTTSTSMAATVLPDVVNPRWNPYDPNDFGEEFPSIQALGEVPEPTVPQDQLAAAVYAANKGDRTSPLGAGCTPGDDDLGDGIWAAGITSAGADTVTIDLVCLYPQQDDMFVAPDGQPCSGPFESGDPCMTNSSDRRRVLALSATAEIAVARLLEPATDRALADLAPTSHADFLTYLDLGTYTPFLLEVRAGVVTRIEQYRSLWLPGL